MMLSMRLTALVLALGFLAIPDFAKANPPEVRPIAMFWKVTVTDKENERHEYAFNRDGAIVKVDTGDWKCTYGPIKANQSNGMYVESTSLICKTGKYAAATSLTCGPRAVGGGRQTSSLIIGANSKTDSIVLDCEPQD